MSKHTMALTYPPKINAVKSGECRQTIRRVGKRIIEPTDVITFHGWIGRPYRSKWSWRKEVVVVEVIPIEISKEGMFIDGIMHAWTSWYSARLAEYDYIDPATGEGLKDVLFKLNGRVPDEPMECRIIQW